MPNNVSRYRLTTNLAITFKANQLDSSVAIACHKTGIIGTVNMPSLPIVLEYQHPLANLDNCRSVLKHCKDAKVLLRKALDRQTLAGIVLSYFNNLRLVDKAHTSASEQNLLLLSSGPIILEMAARYLNYLSHSPYIEDHKAFKKRLPLFSFDWATHASSRSIAQNLMSYLKSLQTATDASILERDRLMSVPMSYVKDIKDKDPVGVALNRVKLAKTVNREFKALRELKSTAKGYYEKIEDYLPTETATMCKLIIRNMHIGVAAKQARLAASKLRLVSHDDAAVLASLLEKATNPRFEDSLYSFSQDVSPKPIKSIKQLLEERKAIRESIITEIDSPEEPVEEAEEQVEDVEEDEQIEDLLDFVETLNRREEESI